MQKKDEFYENYSLLQPAHSLHPKSSQVGLPFLFFLPQIRSSSSFAQMIPRLRNSLLWVISQSGNFPSFRKIMLKHIPKTQSPTIKTDRRKSFMS